MATRNPKAVDPELADWLEYGASPRGTIALDICARSHAYLQGKDFVTPDDVQAVAFDALRHRLVLSFEAEAAGVTTDDVIERLLSRVATANPMHEATQSSVLSGTGAYATLADLIGLRHKAHRLALPRNQTATNPMTGQLRSKHQGRGMDFSEVRLYQAGDDIRSIDWKVTARTSKTHTKVFQEERERPVSDFTGSRTESLFWLSSPV